MKKWNEAPKEINGFKIVKDFGRIDGQRYGIAICKLCGNEFKANLYHIHEIISCGCYIPNRSTPLANNINGFKIIEDLGWDGKRWCIAECKVCQRHYKVVACTLIHRKHCGCLRPKEFKCDYRRSHPRLVRIYKCMKARCYSNKDICYKNYGGRGIRVCEQWLNDANSFCEWALSNRYKENLTIDRIDNNKDYYPENCRWSDWKEQARNRTNLVLTMDIARSIRKEIENMSREELAKKYGCSIGTIRQVVIHKIWKE